MGHSEPFKYGHLIVDAQEMEKSGKKEQLLLSLWIFSIKGFKGRNS